MSTRRTSKAAAVGLPDLLTVEEAGRMLRVGRTKAYAMAREWRATGGRSGLPVVDLGHVLRVPRHVLEARLGVELSNETDAHGPLDDADVSIPVRSAPPETAAPVAPPASTTHPPDDAAVSIPARPAPPETATSVAPPASTTHPPDDAAVSIPARPARSETATSVVPPASTTRPSAARRKSRRGHRHPDGQLSFFPPEVVEAGQEDRREGRGPLRGGPHGAAS